jgi:hypothetical protein
MRLKPMVLLAIMLLSTQFVLQAQTTNPTIYKDWSFLGESSDHFDVEYRVIKCAATPQVHLFVFNEDPNARVLKFDIEITNNADGQKFTKSITLNAGAAEMYRADCSTDNPVLNSLKVDLPAAYDPANILVKITFK